MDAIALLKRDHQRVEKMFREFKRTGDRAVKTRARLVEGIINELSAHAFIEEQVFYPTVRKRVPDLEKDILEAIEEHHIVKWTLSELDGLDPHAENFTAKVTVLIENVQHHVKEEEKEVFPVVRNALSRVELVELGEQLEEAQRVAPAKPHPRVPSKPSRLDSQELMANVSDKVANVSDKVSAVKDRIVDRLT